MHRVTQSSIFLFVCLFSCLTLEWSQKQAWFCLFTWFPWGKGWYAHLKASIYICACVHVSAYSCVCVCVCICNVWIIVHSLLWVAYGVNLRGEQPSLMKTDDRELKPLPVSTALHTCLCVYFLYCVTARTVQHHIHVLGYAPSNPNMSKLFIPLTFYFCCHLDMKVTVSLLFVAGFAGTRDNITLNENLQQELHPTLATSQPNIQPTVQPPKGECVIVCSWLLQPCTANGINSAISHCVLNTPCYLPCLTQVPFLPASAPLGFSLVQAAQMPWHFGNVKQTLTRWHSETSAVFSLKGDGRGMGGRGHKYGCSSNVAFFLHVLCVYVCAREKVAGTLCAVFNLFAFTSTNMGQYSPKWEHILAERSRTKLLLLRRCGESHLSCVPLSGALLLYLACCHGSTSVE